MKVWTEFGEILFYLNDSQAKKLKFEEEVEAKINNLKVVDEIELECMVDEYKRVVDQEEEHQKIFMRYCSSIFPKNDNFMF